MSVELMDDQASSYKFEVKSNKTRLRGKCQKYLEQSKTQLKRFSPPELMITTTITSTLFKSLILKIIDTLDMLHLR